jgi:hydroxyacylglutathione hydrolase
MRVLPVPCLTDNYAYLVVDEQTAEAVVIDPSDAEPVLREADRLGAHVRAALCTHHHADHVGGLPELLERFGGLRVASSALDSSRIPGVTEGVRHGQRVRVGALEATALLVPGHTRGAVAWAIGAELFTGDTLFVAGCGRLFEGTAQQMVRSLEDTIGALDEATRVWCGHEYTAGNLRFAQAVEPRNTAVTEALARVRRSLARGEPTVPSTLAQESRVNPFLRCREPGVIEYARSHGALALDPVSVFSLVRKHKDSFRG